MNSVEYYKMARMETTHWWYRALHTLVLRSIEAHFNQKEIAVLDAGCGTGGLLEYLKNHGYQRLQGFDKSEIAVLLCEQKGLPVNKGDLKDIALHRMEEPVDVVVSNDTLYFLDITGQKKLTDDVYSILNENGLFITNWPAFNAFRGTHDLQVGIKQRFNAKDLWTVFDKNKFELKSKIYWPFLLSPAIWVTRFMQRMKLKVVRSAKFDSDLKDSNWMINSALETITRFDNSYLKWKPFGSSLFLVMQKKSIINRYSDVS